MISFVEKIREIIRAELARAMSRIKQNINKQENMYIAITLALLLARIPRTETAAKRYISTLHKNAERMANPASKKAVCMILQKIEATECAIR